MKFRYLSNVVTLQLDAERCTGCGMCVEVCPQQVFALSEKRSKIIDRDACLECGACARNCVRGAVSVRPGVGCAYAILMNKLKRKGSYCGGSCGCSLDEYSQPIP